MDTLIIIRKNNIGVSFFIKMEPQNKSKVWWCDECKHYISGNYKECPYCKVLKKIERDK